MRKPTTALILARRALQESAGEECVDWALSLLESGHDSQAIRRLAGMVPPFNHFELSSMRDHILTELKPAEISRTEAIREYVSELLEGYLANKSSAEEVLPWIQDLYCSNYEDSKSFQSLYLLFHARADLAVDSFSYHWQDATRENIEDLIRQHAEKWLKTHRQSV